MSAHADAGKNHTSREILLQPLHKSLNRYILMVSLRSDDISTTVGRIFEFRGLLVTGYSHSCQLDVIAFEHTQCVSGESLDVLQVFKRRIGDAVREAAPGIDWSSWAAAKSSSEG